MLKRLRTAHPIRYCILSEVLFLGIMMLASFLILAAILAMKLDVDRVEDYLVSALQELVGLLTAVFLLKRTGKAELLRRRGCGFFNGLLVGMYPLLQLALSLYSRLMLLPEGNLLPAWRIGCFLGNMILVGVAEEVLFRGVIAQTLLEHFGTGRAGVWKACLLSGVLFGAAHLSNLIGSAPLGVLMQCVFAASLGTLYTAVYFRTGNLWITVFLHAGMDITSMLAGGLYGTQSVAESISGYDLSMLASVFIYLIPTVFLLRKKKIGEVALYFGRDCRPQPVNEG